MPPFAVAQKFFIEIVCDKLIVQTVETSKVIDRALSGVFARSTGFHQKRPVTGLRQQKLAGELLQNAVGKL